MLFHLNTRVVKAQKTAQKIKVTLEKGGENTAMTFDKLLVAVGRKPLTEGLGFEEAGIETDPGTGHIIVDTAYQTRVPGVYAIGDLTPGPMLAHKASAEGIAVVENIAGHAGEVNYDTLPSVIYTWPEVASVGLTEEAVKEREIPYCVGTYPFSGAGRARCMGEKEGFVKLIFGAKYGELLGAHIIGHEATEMIAEACAAMSSEATAESLAATMHAHPTMSEAFHEATLDALGRAIHL